MPEHDGLQGGIPEALAFLGGLSAGGTQRLPPNTHQFRTSGSFRKNGPDGYPRAVHGKHSLAISRWCLKHSPRAAEQSEVLCISECRGLLEMSAGVQLGVRSWAQGKGTTPVQMQMSQIQG